jgi:hypothetical protein
MGLFAGRQSPEETLIVASGLKEGLRECHLTMDENERTSTGSIATFQTREHQL